MNRMERRRYLILCQLAEANRYIASKDIAEKLHTTDRTVRKDLAAIHPRMESLGIRICKKVGLGYRMAPESVEVFRRLGETALAQGGDSIQAQRFHYLVQRLLAAEEPLKSIDLADELFVSQTIVSGELRQVRRHFAEFGLAVENIPAHGIRLTGAEQHIRSCMISEYAAAVPLQDGRRFIGPFQELFSTPGEELLNAVRAAARSVLKSEDGKPYFIAEDHIQSIILAILLSLNRQGREMPFTEREIYETRLTRSFQAAQKLLATISAETGVRFSEAEEIYLGNLILGYRTFLRFGEVSVKENYYRALNNASESIIQLYARFGVRELVYDRNLRERLALHLLSLEARLVTGMIPERIITREMGYSFVMAREFATCVGAHLEKIYDCTLHESEIDRLALLFLPNIPQIGRREKRGCRIAVASQTYPRDIALPIAQRHINSCEGMAGQVFAYEEYQTKAIVRSGCDLLLTDIPESRFAGFSGDILPYYFDLSEEDARAVQGWYNGKDEIWRQLRACFRQELFFSQCEASSREEALTLAERLLEDSGAADCSLYRDLFQASCHRLTISDNGIGFVKTAFIYGEQTFCGVFRFREPVAWNASQLKLLLVLSTGFTSPEDFLLFNGWLETLLADRNAQLPEAALTDFGAFMAWLRDYFMKH